MNKPNFAEDFSSLPTRRSRVRAALAEDVPEVDDTSIDEPRTVDMTAPSKATEPGATQPMQKRGWSSIKAGLNTRIPEEMKRMLDDLVWVRGKEATNAGKAKPQIQDIVTEAIGDLLGKHRALLAKYDLL